MKIVVLSDTHGSFSAWKTAESLIPGAAFIIHAGDVLYHGPRNPLPDGYSPMELAEAINQSSVPVHLVRGNCDAEVDYMVLGAQASDTLVLELDGLTVLVNHGHNLNDKLLIELAQPRSAKLIITGHTHIPRLEKLQGHIFLNPGSIALPKGGYPATAAIVTSNRIEIVTLDTNEVIIGLDI